MFYFQFSAHRSYCRTRTIREVVFCIRTRTLELYLNMWEQQKEAFQKENYCTSIAVSL